MGNDPKKEMHDSKPLDMSAEGIAKSFQFNLNYGLAKDRHTTTEHDNFLALSMSVLNRIVERWIKTQQGYHKKNVKRVYYLSLEFLIGRLLSNNALNLGLKETVSEALKQNDLDWDSIENEECDAGLGNGGLGRLAACFLDSMATLGVPSHGYGIRYDYGIFRQRIVNGYQVESPDEWLKQGNPWEFQRPEAAVTVQFFGETNMYHDKRGKLCVEWRQTQDVLAMPFDIPVPGYGNDVVNTLRLWAARSSEEFDLEYFNHGDYENAVFNKMFSENISRVLYPNDATARGRELRLKQEYFFTAASISDIIRRFKTDNTDIRQLPEKTAIQLNDTHPALAVVELMRILMDREELDWETAWDVTVRTFAYTNHTVMPEALECWSVQLFERMLPRHMQIVYEINARFLREVANCHPGDNDRLRRMSLIEEGGHKMIRMAYLALVGSHSVNGVSELHSHLIKTQLFKDFYEVYPERFNNKTNGITHRRWLLNSNPGLSGLITQAIGNQWVSDLPQLEKLKTLTGDAGFCEKWLKVKTANKKAFSDYLQKTAGVKLDPASLFDVQIKRIHEYKRQTLFALSIIAQYLQMKNQPQNTVVPRTFIFGGKAAPGYQMAKLIIKFINNIGGVVNNDRSMRGKMKVVFLENYCVSLAEKIFPASDLSEQISTAGTEASGTGCMKFMMNGALTVGTLDGANIEMADAVGHENMFIFGLKAEEAEKLKREGYSPGPFIEKSPVLTEIFHMVRSNFFSQGEPGIFEPLLQNLTQRDPFLVCADFEAYHQMQSMISQNFMDVKDWTRKAVLNVAFSGRFSSDRTIREYCEDIWKVECAQPVHS